LTISFGKQRKTGENRAHQTDWHLFPASEELRSEACRAQHLSDIFMVRSIQGRRPNTTG
jgi:hypothetical protein